ncbi:MAG: protein kinase [Myxococcales bacterium]|nr:protein kinase [Myxococcales bacterium]
MAQPGWAGRIIDGRYVVESVIGAGGMGLVLKARHRFTGADVALKVLKPELELDTEVQMRFLAEARAPTAIGHPGIVSVIDAGKAPDGVLYLVMELLLGRPLRIPLARGELAAGDMRRILLELLEALGVAHTRGFVHRDLKPENVFLCGPSATVKLLDFGIAKVLDAGIAKVKTQTGSTLGTPAYMAPEQFHDPSGVDPRADLWAVGVMTYEMLAGRLPFRADTAQSMLLAVATMEPDPITAHLPDAPPVVEAFFRRALSRDLAGRFASAPEMATALAALPLGAPQIPAPAPRAHRPSAAPPPAGPAGMGATMATGYGGTQATGHGGTLATGHGGTQATGWQTPPPGQTPPPAQTPGAHPPAPPAASTPSRPVPALAAQPATNRKAWIIGLGLASAVSIAAVVLAVSMTRSSSPAADPGPGSAAAPGSGIAKTVANDPPPPPPPPVDAAVIAHAPPEPVDAAPMSARDQEKAMLGILDPDARSRAPRDAGAGAAKPPKRSADPIDDEADEADTPPPALSTKELCSRACYVAIQKCGIASATCINDCMANDELQKCARQPFTSCNAAAICGMRATCGSMVLRGSGTCAQAATCQAQCGLGDFACGCACARAMSPARAALLSAFDACALNCKLDGNCVARNCQRQGQACVSN